MLEGGFIEIYREASLATSEIRHLKGMYKKARNDEIKHYTGIGSPYEEQIKLELVIDTEALDLEISVQTILAYQITRGWLAA